MELSDRNRRFCELIVYGDTPSISQAYRDTRDSKASPKNARAEASRLWHSPKCKTYAEKLRRDLLNRGRARAANDRERIVRGLWFEADNAQRAADRISALRILGTVSTVGLFEPEPLGNDDTLGDSSAEIAASIETLLREVVNGAEVGSGEPNSGGPQPPLLGSGSANYSKHQTPQAIRDRERMQQDSIDVSPSDISSVIDVTAIPEGVGKVDLPVLELSELGVPDTE